MTSALVCCLLLSPAQAAPIEVPFRIAEDAIIVDAIVNGRKASFMFDTGFSGAMSLTDSINIGPPTGTMRLRDFVGEFEAATVKVKSLQMGALKFETAEAAQMEVVQKPMEHLSLSYNTHTDGIMGLEVVRNHITEINFERSRFIFHPKTTDITTRTPDNKRTFLAKMLPKGNNSIEMLVETKEGKKMVLALDTGNAFYAATHRDVLERVGLWKEGVKPNYMRQSMVASGPVDSWYRQVKDVKIYGVPVAESIWSIIDLPASSAEGDGTIGFGFLKNFNVIIDMDRRRVWLENFTGKVADAPTADVGIIAFYDSQIQRVEIVRVVPGSPADRAGIKDGDHLLGVDGAELRSLGFRQIMRLLEGAPGTKVMVSVSRGGLLSRHELQRELLVNAQ